MSGITVSDRQLAAIKFAVFVACLLPFAGYGHAIYADTLGANPIEALTRGLGTWALNLLLVTLAVTPARRLTGMSWLLRLRRMLGLFAFFYAALHLGTYLWLDQFFDWPAIAKDILKRPFITVGMAAFALLLPLAATSNRYSIRRLGGRRWQSLHRAVYAIGVLAVLHYFWMVKLDTRLPLAYAGVLVALLGARAWWRGQELSRQRQSARLPTRPIVAGRKVIPMTLKK